MATKKKKKLRIFSNFSLDYVENDVFYPEMYAELDRNRSDYYSRWRRESVPKRAEVLAVYLKDTESNEKYVKEYRENSDNLFSKSGFSGIYDVGIANNQGNLANVSVGITNDSDLNNSVREIYGHPFVPVLPRLKRLKTDEDKLSYIKGISPNGKFHSYDGKLLELYNIVETLNKNGVVLDPNTDRNSLYRWKNFSANQYDLLQRTIAWIIVFNELAVVEDENRKLSELLKDSEFVNRIESLFENFRVELNNYTAGIIKTVLDSSYPICISYAKTLKTRDAFLELRGKDIKSFKVFENHDNIKKRDELAQRINLTVSSSTANIHDIAEEWVGALQGKKTVNTIKETNYLSIISYAEYRAKSNIFANYDSDSEIDDVFILNKVHAVSPTSRASNLLRSNSENVLIRLLNLFGEDYIRNEVRISHLSSLISVVSYPLSFFHGANVDWVEKFVLASVGEGEVSKEEKDKILELLYEIYVDLSQVRISLRVIKKDSTMFDMYKSGLPLKVILNTMNISHSDGDARKETEVRALHGLGY